MYVVRKDARKCLQRGPYFRSILNRIIKGYALYVIKNLQNNMPIEFIWNVIMVSRKVKKLFVLNVKKS